LHGKYTKKTLQSSHELEKTALYSGSTPCEANASNTSIKGEIDTKCLGKSIESSKHFLSQRECEATNCQVMSRGENVQIGTAMDI
jgi:hypothetical protein